MSIARICSYNCIVHVHLSCFPRLMESRGPHQVQKANQHLPLDREEADPPKNQSPLAVRHGEGRSSSRSSIVIQLLPGFPCTTPPHLVLGAKTRICEQQMVWMSETTGSLERPSIHNFLTGYQGVFHDWSIVPHMGPLHFLGMQY